MSKYNKELQGAGVRIIAKGLHPSSSGIRLSFKTPGEKPIMTEGSFENPKELVSDFFLIEVESREEAVDWAQGREIELRQVFE